MQVRLLSPIFPKKLNYRRGEFIGTFKNYQGTKDYLPYQIGNQIGTSKLIREIESKFVEVNRLYEFKEIIVPTLEFAAIYERSGDADSDMVKKEMFAVATDKTRLVLRPEGTAGVIRSYVQNKLYDAISDELVKLYYVGSMFRKERPQAGRQREFKQLGAEVIGVNDPYIDIEMIAMAQEFFSQIGLNDLRLEINSIGCSDCRNQYKAFLKKELGKVLGLCDLCVIRKDTNPLRVFDCKDDRCSELTKSLPVISQYLCEECNKEFSVVKEGLSMLSIPFVENPTLVRGLDYYEKTVFEFIDDAIGAQSSVCGGGRYTSIIEEMGGPPKSGIGFAIGLERVLITLSNQNKIADTENEIDYFLVWTTEEAKRKLMKVAQKLRANGCSVSMFFESKKMKKQLKEANRKRAKFAIILGEEELSRNSIQLKDLKTSIQNEVDLSEFMNRKKV